MSAASANEDVRFCARCLYGTDHPLGIVLDAEGICSGCRIHEEKDRLDWRDRWTRLEALVTPYRSRRPDLYDCIVPVTGAHDSYWVMHQVRDRLGLNPLMVTYNRYFNTPLGIRNLANLRIRFGCDLLIQNVNPEAVKRITRSTLMRFGSVYWPCLAGHSVYPVQVAVQHRIPLIIWGAHQGLEQVGMFSHEHEVQMTRRNRKDHDLMGFEADDLLSVFDNLGEEDVWQYRYPSDGDLNAVGVCGVYLGNYVRWDPKAQHEAMTARRGYRGARFARTFDTYDFVDCFNYMGVHDLLKLYKHGYSKVTDHATREIRHGRLTRQEGLALVRHHELRAPDYLDLFRQWLGVSETGLEFAMNQHRNPRYWRQPRLGTWEFDGWSRRHGPLDPGGETSPASRAIERLGFAASDTVLRNDQRRYIVLGKGHPD